MNKGESNANRERKPTVSAGKNPIAEMYGSCVFSDAVMRQWLPKNVYEELKRTIEEGKELDAASANVIANAMKDWALEKGATHFCHWFQPLTGLTAEKHDSFIAPTENGGVMMEFSGNELIQSEPDASSFPSGGLRATFEARGYTAWDCTSPVFVKADGMNVSLFIPSAYCSYNGEALDEKTPLMRSMDALNRHAVRVLRALGDHTTRNVHATMGCEQEYFLIDEHFVKDRPDIFLTGRTLFGAPSPRGQELHDHYFGSLHERIASFMNEVNSELWKLGVAAKTQHNEVAPGQYEVAPVFSTVNVAADQNQLIMETLRKLAPHHGFMCLLHEKPFAGVNGSGKHNNWSMNTDDGTNLLDPGDTPHENMQFLIFLFAVIRAVDKYPNLLRSTVASAGNDHRLGGNEAPPAILSIFLGEQLTHIIEQLEDGRAGESVSGGHLKLGVSTLPPLPKDCTDRNRTSPFAFTGNKFEYRMPGASQSLAGPNFVLNTIVADVLAEIADVLEASVDVNQSAQELLQKYASEHHRIIFNGDNYSEEWCREAEERGLPNISNTVDSLLRLPEQENIDVLSRQGVLSGEELEARQQILLQNYATKIHIEATTALQMARRQIFPAGVNYTRFLAKTVNDTKQAGGNGSVQAVLLRQVEELTEDLQDRIESLERNVHEAAEIENTEAQSKAYRDNVLPAMDALRETADNLEQLVDKDTWPFSSYAEMMFVR